MNAGRVLAAVGLLVPAVLAAQDWPQWRGAERNGISPGRLGWQWPGSGPAIRWRADVGTGFSSLAVAQGRVYTLGNTNEQDTLWCLDARTGGVLWRKDYGAKLDPQYYEGGPGATPTLDAGQVFTIGKWGMVLCLDATNGTVIWQQDLRAAGFKPNRWGFAGSPLLWGDLVLLNAGSAGMALERKTGRIVWSTGTNATGYASPTRFRAGGRDGVLMFAAKHLVALDPLTGSELWRHPWDTKWDTNITDPLVQEDRVFISSFTHGCALLRLTGQAPEVLYESKVLFNHLSPGIVLGEDLYAFNGEAKFATDFRCVHLPDGSLKWSTKDPAFGTVICVGGKLVILSEKGELVIADPSPGGFRPLARGQVLSGLCWTPPAFAQGLLYARSAKGALVCVDLRPAP